MFRSPRQISPIARLVSALILISIVVFTVSCADKKETASGEVVQVVDGDTLKVKVGKKTETVRMLFIDSPETNDPELGEQPFGMEAKLHLEELVSPGSKVTLEFGPEKHDKYGRLLAHVQLEKDKETLQEKLLKEGLARVAYLFHEDEEMEKRYRKAEEEARKKRLRIWSVDGYVHEKGFNPKAVERVARFVASKRSDVYHPVECKEVVKQIHQDNRVPFATEGDAKASGRRLSQVCKAE
ncbi:thermonuclease family protein [Staphylospora marina]|uniref:thermonuclease family protein n=1 Tax=Staphylospora marina TaxID=2490858 RepID=UPI000F5BCE69|nr:thermonuclease family protein [Staphylospora marina]